jgi:hypothetical protein
MSRLRRVLWTLEYARRLVEKGWVKYAYAKNAKGEVVSPYGRDATHFCSTGATRVAIYEELKRQVVGQNAGEAPHPGEVYAILSEAIDIANVWNESSTHRIMTANDQASTSKADVLRWFDKAIIRVKEQIRCEGHSTAESSNPFGKPVSSASPSA